MGKEPKKTEIAVIENGEVEKGKRSYELVKMDIPLTDKELRFLQILLEGEIKPEVAIFQAGYDKCSRGQRYLIAKKIIKKYEQQAQGAANILRDVGWGELTISQRLKRIGLKAKTPGAQLKACELGMRALGMLEQNDKQSEGVTIVIQGPGQVNVNQGQPPVASPTNPDQPGYQHPQPTLPGKPITITK